MVSVDFVTVGLLILLEVNKKELLSWLLWHISSQAKLQFTREDSFQCQKRCSAKERHKKWATTLKQCSAHEK